MQISIALLAGLLLRREEPLSDPCRARALPIPKSLGWVFRLVFWGGLLFCCSIGAGWAQTSQSEARLKSITVVTDDNYPPFIFRDSSGEVQGILKDSWALWEAHTGISVDLQAMNWGKAQAIMAAGQADVIDTLFETEPRKLVFDFGKPYATLDVPIFFHQSVSGIVNVDSIKGFTVGVKDGDACIDALHAKGVDSIKKYPSYLDVISAAGAGDIRVFCVDQPPAVYLLNQLGIASQFRHSLPLYTGEFHRAVHKGNTALLKTIEDGFAQITPAERKAIEQKWYGAEVGGVGFMRFADYARYAAYALLGIFSLAAALVLWNFSLRGRVAKKTAELSLTIDALHDAKTVAEQSLAQLNGTLAAIPDLMFEVGLDGKYHDFHSMSDSLLVAPAPSLLGKTIVDVMPAEQAGIVLEAIQQAHETGASHGRQIRLEVPDGVRWFELSIARKSVEPGSEPRFIVLSRDVTDRKLAQEALASKTALLRDTFDNMSEGISIMDGNLGLAGWNRRFAELLELPESLLNDRTTFADIIRFNAQRGEYGPGDPEEQVRERVALASKTQTHHFERVRPNGCVIEVRGLPLPGGGFVTTYTDITARKHAEAARESLEGQLRESQKMQAIGTLAGGIAHDFNNIIAAILGNTQLARQDAIGNSLALESLGEIHKSATRARSLVQQILSFSRRQPTTRKPISLAPVIEDAVRLLRATLPGRVVVDLRIDTETPLVLADDTQIQQVAINLVNNATQAMRDAPGRIEIRVDTVLIDAAFVQAHPGLRGLHAAHPGRAVRLSVADNGPGMDAGTMGRIFEPFFTTKPIDEGTGLGLSVVHGIVQTHEGAITVESQPGKGATFAVYLPTVLSKVVEAPAEPVEPVSVGQLDEAEVSSGRHILYLDDDASLVSLVTRLLGRQGYRVSGFIDQQEALAAIRKNPNAFDLVVTDYNMPGMSGLDVAREIRALRADLPVAVASGFVDEALQVQAGGAGVRELIFKASAAEEFCAAFVRLAQAESELPQRG
jgi:two-component system, cell cycle sensor histidine kinase and response regulator CckA